MSSVMTSRTVWPCPNLCGGAEQDMTQLPEPPMPTLPCTHLCGQFTDTPNGLPVPIGAVASILKDGAWCQGVGLSSDPEPCSNRNLPSTSYMDLGEVLDDPEPQSLSWQLE